MDNNNEPNNGLPEDTVERLRWWAELHSKTYEDAVTAFLDWAEDNLGMSDPSKEDPLFIDEASETFVVERRVMTSPGGNSIELVGMFLGVDDKVKDKRERSRTDALNAARDNLSTAINNGVVARAFVESGVWMLEKANGVVASTQERFVEGEDPWFLVRDAGLTLAMLQTNPEWARHGEPIAPYLYSRTLRFSGNTPEAFADDILELRIDVSGATPEDVSYPVKEGYPCRIRVRPQSENVSENWKDVYRAVNNFYQSINYTDDFVDEEDRGLLVGERYMPSLKCYVDDLRDLNERYNSGMEQIPGFDNPVGPLVLVKGKVTDMNHTGWEAEYDPTGMIYTMRISSFALQREYPNDRFRQEVNVRMHGFLVDENNAFHYNGGDGWKPYAIRSTVYIYGRLGQRVTDDGNTVPTIKALGVYTPSRLAIPAGEGGNTSLGQFGGN